MPAAADDSSLQTRLERTTGERDTAGRATTPSIADPVALLAHLEANGHFHRDSRAGRMYHPGMVSLREDVPTDSLHVSVDGNRVKAHVDEVSPLAVATGGGSRYSLPRAMAHNAAGIAGDLLAVVRGRQGDHRCELDCEWTSDAAGAVAPAAGLLDPKTSAWGVQLEARVAGPLDATRLCGALDALIGVRGAGEACLTVVECDDAAALDRARRRLHGVGVPLDVLPPFHVCLAHQRGGDVLMLNLNHAAVDGFGATRLLDHIARAYGDGEVEALDFLACADLPARPSAPATSRLARLRRAGLERLRDTLSRPPRLAADGAGDRAGYGFHLVGLSAAQTRETLAVGGAHDTRDVLIAALQLAIADWNAGHERPAQRIGVLVPVDLRPAELPAHAFANLSVNTRLSTTRHDRATPAATLKAVVAEARRDAQTRSGLALIAALQRAGMLGLWAKQSRVVLQPLTDNRFADAAMLCDLGCIDPVPDFGPAAGEVREIWFSPPSRSPRCLCLGAVIVAGGLHLTFRYPHRLFGPDAVRRFADGYLAALRRVSGASAARL